MTTSVVIGELTTSRKNQQDAVYCQRDLWHSRADDDEKIGPFRYRFETKSGLEHFRIQAALPA